MLQFSNASKWNECLNETISTANISTFKKSCLESGESNGVLLSNEMICIPGLCKPIMQWSHQKPIDIKMSNVEVVEIDMLRHTFTISMYLSIKWMELRIQLFRHSTIYGKDDWEKFYLTKGEQKEVWSPQIVMATNKVRQNDQGWEFGVSNLRRHMMPWVYKDMDLNSNTEIKCEMSFRTFPFDKHVCILEVRNI